VHHPSWFGHFVLLKGLHSGNDLGCCDPEGVVGILLQYIGVRINKVERPVVISSGNGTVAVATHPIIPSSLSRHNKFFYVIKILLRLYG
jgi:hypothetical protein